MSATNANSPATPAATPAAAADATQDSAAPELDYVSLLVRDDTPKAPDAAPAAGGDGKDAATPADADDAQAAGGEGDGTQATEPDTAAGDGTGADDAAQAAAGDAPQQPGTPDKALQKLQQDFAAQTRKVDALLAKLDSGQGLTAQEKKDAQQAKRKLDGIREAIAAKGADFDLLQHDQDVAGALLEHDDALTTTQAELAETKRRLAALEQQNAQATVAQAWAGVQAAYPGVQVKAVWDKAAAEAYAKIGVSDPAKLPADSPLHAAAENLANDLFHTRAGAAAAAVKAKGGAGVKPAATGTTPPPTPNAARVSAPNPAGHTAGGELSEEAQYERDALALVK